MASGLQPIFSRPRDISRQLDQALVEGIKKQFPIENRDFRLDISDIAVHKKDFSHQDEKDAILKSKSLTYPIKGTLTLTDKATGKIVDTERNFPLADNFSITGKHTMVYKGNNYAVANLLQLKEGVYTRLKDDGFLEAFFNTGTGQVFSIKLDPETQLFTMIIKSSKAAIAPILSDVFELTDATISKYIPMEVWLANVKDAAPKKDRTINALYSRLVSRRLQNPDASMEEKKIALKTALESSKLNESTTKITLGLAAGTVSGEVILRAMSNLVKVHKGDRAPDNRDSLQFKRVQNLPDFIERRFKNDKEHETVTNATRKLNFHLEKIDKSNPKIKSAVTSKPYNKVLTNFILSSNLSSTLTETNPIDSLENVGKVTLMGPGEGGISSERGVPDESRNIDPSHLGIIDPSRTPESSTAGIDQRFTISARRDRAGNLYARVKDLNGKVHFLSTGQMMDSVIGFANQENKKGKVQAQDKGQIREVDRSKVQYWLSDSTDMYTITTNLVPFLNSNHPGRLTMAGKAIPQALSLKNREAPLVQTVDDKGGTFVNSLGKFISTVAPVDGVVSRSASNGVTIKDKDGKAHKIALTKNLPFNMKGFLDDEAPTVKVGDTVTKGQILSDNNYTKDGDLALGRNLYTAYIPYKGFNHEDGIVLSRSAAKELDSLHAYKFDYKIKADTVDNKALFKRYFGTGAGAFSAAQLAKLDDRGYAKKGIKLHYGDPVYAILEKKVASPEDKALGRLHKTLVTPYRKVVEIWDHEEPGEVVDTHTNSKSIRILVRSVKPLEIGDKITGLHGNKGVVSKILEDHEMPFSKTIDKPVDILLNPASVTSRINFGQIMETAAAKIAQKTGKPYQIKNYGKDSNIASLKQELKEHGLKDTDLLIDPDTGKEMGAALAGPQYMLKLDKTNEANYSARNVGSYDGIMQPSRGGSTGSKRVGYMELMGLLGSDARKNLKEMATVKSEENTEFWDSFMSGRPLPKPKQTFATKKFFDYLKAVGINTKVDDGHIQAVPMTDYDILNQSNGALTAPLRLNSKNLEPEKGGLFDISITGGVTGNKWSHYKLAEPIVNPMFEKPVKSLLGLSSEEFNNITSGAFGVKKKEDGGYSIVDTAKDQVIRDIAIRGMAAKKGFKKLAAAKPKTDEEPLVSGAAFEALLSEINVDKELKESIDQATNEKAVSKREAAIKRAKYLKGLKDMEIKPQDSYILRNMPVLPPNMRPVINKGGNQLEFADANQFYKEHMLVNMPTSELLNEMSPEFLTNERAGLYKGVKALMGMGDALSGQTRGLKLKGIMKEISGAGAGPKTGLVQGKLLSRKQDFSGRGTIYAAPDVGFNEVKYPVDGLWTMYRAHIERDLAKSGYNRAEIGQAYRDRTLPAQNSFNKVIKDVPILINRAPTLMRTNFMAMFPVPVDGKTIGLNPLHLPGFAADYDGDAMSTYVPMTPEAITEAKEKMLPTRHLSDARKGFGNPMFAPGHEAILGSVHLTSPDKDQKTVTFKTEHEALKALKAGDIEVNTPIKILGNKTKPRRKAS